MKINNNIKWLPAFLIALIFAFSASVQAASGNYSTDVDLDPILELIEKEEYETAINQLFDELDADPDNPDILSLLGFSHRKIQNYEDAMTFYEWALKVEPEHKGANEYLGELYLETNQFDKAMQQLEILDGLCGSKCKEYSQLKEAIDSYQEASASSS